MTAFETTQDFSEFDFTQLGTKFASETEYSTTECWGSIEEEMNNKKVEKKCGGTVTKSRVYGDGSGTVKLTGHVPYAWYCTAFGMDQDELADGVKAYGYNSVHPEFSLTADVCNEDGVHKFKAYPRCKIIANLSRKIERGAEEVAEVDLEIEVYPDNDGNGMYEAIVDNIADDEIKTTWMKGFTPDLVMKSA